MAENKPVMPPTNGAETTQNVPDDGDFAIVRNFKQVYRRNWRQITSISPGDK